ncbi:hypothetical protein QQF64_015754 [Cirrhinus molitorella]|uniref:Uncharacterized protein n=1 Tax=Cirrhinus molitorella TaxID=172907 RepID=A0ABR3NW73_9TELE
MVILEGLRSVLLHTLELHTNLILRSAPRERRGTDAWAPNDRERICGLGSVPPRLTKMFHHGAFTLPLTDGGSLGGAVLRFKALN